MTKAIDIFVKYNLFYSDYLAKSAKFISYFYLLYVK
jgi:hypothetical protein